MTEMVVAMTHHRLKTVQRLVRLGRSYVFHLLSGAGVGERFVGDVVGGECKNRYLPGG